MNALPLSFAPNYFTQKSIVAFFGVLLVCSLLFFNRMLPSLWIVFGFIEVFCFFFFLNRLTRQWSKLTEPVYAKKLFRTSLWIRVAWVGFSYLFYDMMSGEPFEFGASDSKGYHGEALWLLGLINDGKWSEYIAYIGKNYSDMGYPVYLALIYKIVGENLFWPRLLKALLGSYTCLLIYKIARNNFGEATGRMAGIMTMLVPNLIYYTGLHLKETEMVFVVVCVMYLADKLLQARQLNLTDIVLLGLSVSLLFFFRTVLAACLIGAVIMATILTSRRIVRPAHRMALLFVLLVGVGGLLTTPLATNLFEYVQDSEQNQASQMQNFAVNRSEGEGNKLATYGSRSIFLPMMIMAPFPTLIDIADQKNAMMMAGAYFTRNVYAFFVLIALYTLYKRRKILEHVLLLAFVASYIFVLASSGFALSERFHLPLVPFLLILASYGVSQMNHKNKKYYLPYLVLISLVVVGWNWFKIAGRS